MDVWQYAGEAIEQQEPAVCKWYWIHNKKSSAAYFTLIKQSENRVNLKLQLKPVTYLLNILIQLLVRVDLSHQVLQLLLTEHLERKPLTQLQKSTGVHMLCPPYSCLTMSLNAKIRKVCFGFLFQMTTGHPWGFSHLKSRPTKLFMWLKRDFDIDIYKCHDDKLSHIWKNKIFMQNIIQFQRD